VPNDSGRFTPIEQFGAEAMTFIAKLLKDESGATAIEYGLIAAGIAVAIIAAVQGLGTQLKATFTSVSGALG
jgi:pilus assembly protein Flp/PilA